jgi:uncharacterized protein
MQRIVTISAGPVTVDAELLQTPTADALWNALPLAGGACIWGEEVYFAVPVQVALEKDAAEVVNAGDLGYWPGGAAFCMFFGPTPVSRPGEIRPASAVNVFGRLTGDPSVLSLVRAGSRVTVRMQM